MTKIFGRTGAVRSTGNVTWGDIYWRLLAVLVSSMLAASAGAQSLATTTVEDTVYRADGTPAAGSAVISWGAFTTAAGAEVQAGSTTTTLSADGVLDVGLAPNAGAVPMGSYYSVVFHLADGTVQREYWVVPVTVAGGGPVHLASVRNQVLPTAIAMQSVTKSYVDAAIARAQLAPLDSSPYVEKSGDTMTGPLVLPGDPSTPQQAADKSYVDTSVSAVQSGLNGKVALLPSTTQTIGQPSGTELAVTRENGAVHAAALYDNVAGVNAVSLLAGPDCTNGCKVIVGEDYPGTEPFGESQIPAKARLVDERGGGWNVWTHDSGGQNALVPNSMDNAATESAAAFAASTANTPIGSATLLLTENALAGGSNQQALDVEAPPFFKSTYIALSMASNSYTPGQHITSANITHCYSVGDCLDNSNILWTSGDFHDDSDEGTHPGDQFISEDTDVFRGSCQTGCTSGSTHVALLASTGSRTAGEGRYLLNMNSAKDVLGATIVSADTNTYPFNEVTLSGTSFATSTFLQTASAATSQPHDLAPGTVTLPIATSGVPAGYATNTAALPASSGVACVADPNSHTFAYFETANYTVVDATHVQLTLHYVHHNGATIAVGGMCGYGIEQTIDTRNGIRQVFPVVGTLSSTQVLYADSHTGAIGVMGLKSGYANYSQTIASAVRSSNVVTVTLAGAFGPDLTGLTLAVSGVSDPSFNGSFPSTMTSNNSFTYANSGPDASSTGGTAAYATQGVAMYPMAEVRNVFDTATQTLDDTLDLAPNTVNWANGDAVEVPHYFSLNAHPDTEIIAQTMPRPDAAVNTAGKSYGGNVGPGLTGWSIENSNSASEYLGGGGTHYPPMNAYVASGVWQNDMSLTAGEDSVFTVNCNLHGCNRYDSNYALFLLQRASGYDLIRYDPASSTLGLFFGAGSYSFSPTAFTAPTINAGTINATKITGATFGASGTSHAAGLVPDPGAGAGTSRYLREDGAWVTPNFATTANPTFSGTSVANGDLNVAAATAATATVNVSSPNLKVCGNDWNGSASAQDCFVFQNQIGSGTNGQPQLFISHTGPGANSQWNVANGIALNGSNGAFLNEGVFGNVTSGFGTWSWNLGSTGALIRSATTTATSSTNYAPPSESDRSSVWSGTAAMLDTWTKSVVLGAGANPTSYLTFAHVGSSGTAALAAPLFHESLMTPASSSAACSAGDFADDANFHYVCVATNTWKRAALSAF